jgi:hypothetical protein
MLAKSTKAPNPLICQSRNDEVRRSSSIARIAKTHAVEVPPTLLALADEVIE